MKPIKLSQRWTVGLALLAFALILNAPAVNGAPLMGGSPVPGGPGFVMVSGLQFRPESASMTYAYSGTAVYNSGTSGQYFTAPVNLPNGAVVNNMVIYYTDPIAIGVDSDLRVNLNLASGYDPTVYIMAALSSASHSTPVDGYAYLTTNAITYPTINLAANAYLLQVYLPPSTSVRLNAVRIDYGYPTSLPLVAK